MAEENTRLKKFLADQEEAVSIARGLPDGSSPVRIDALNVALSLAHCNALASGGTTSMTEIMKDAAKVEKYLKGGDEH
jgi:hypothetical protein